MRRPTRQVPAARLRIDLPFAMLGGAALASPVLILQQGGEWHTAILGLLVVLGAPGAAIETMVGLVRLLLWFENDPG